MMKSELTWEEYLQSHSLPHSQLRVDSFNGQQAIRWSSTDFPERMGSDVAFPRMRSLIMEVVSRYQQETWWPYGIYTESILTTLMITLKFGQTYPRFYSSHHYGITTWCMLIMYCVYGNRHWSLVCVIILGPQFIILRIDPISMEIDQDTRHILDYLQCTRTLCPQYEFTSSQQDDIMIDITVLPFKDSQACGLRCYNIMRFWEMLWRYAL
jgi:hypothetical protein